MGFFVFDDTRAIPLDDRVLAHLQIVIVDKLRRRESFGLNLKSDGTMVTMWLSCYTPLQFIYEGNRQPRINWRWVDLLAAEAGFTGMLELRPEPTELRPEPTEAVPIVAKAGAA